MASHLNVTALDVITEALGLVGVYSPGESIDSSESADALRTLNFMLKSSQWKLGIWLNRELKLFLQKNTKSYSIGPTGTHCAVSSAKTEIATAASSGASSVVIDATTDFGDTFDRNGLVTATTPAGAGDVTLTGALVTNGIAVMSSDRNILVYSDADDSGVSFGITGTDGSGNAVTETLTGPNTTTVYSANTYKKITSITIDGAGTGNIEIGQVGDHVGIELDDGTLQWTNIAAALSTTLTLMDALTDDVAVDNHVYSYTEKTERPTEIIEARLYYDDGRDVPIFPMGRLEYMTLSNKSQTGTPNQIYYDKQLTNGTLNIWPVTDDVQTYIKMSAHIPITIIENLTDNFEFAEEFFEALAWNLAIRLFPKYGKPIDPLVMKVAQDMAESAFSSDSENSSCTIEVG